MFCATPSSHAVGEGQFIVCNVCFEAIVADVIGEEVDECSQQQVVGGNDAIGCKVMNCLIREKEPFCLSMELVPFLEFRRG
mgnify:CR=1 FL=1